MDIAAYLLDCKGICLSAQQRAAVEAPVGTVLLLAVPGAGKTTVLAARIARLLTQEGEVPEGILTLTFGRESVRDLRRRWEAFVTAFWGSGPQRRGSDSRSFWRRTGRGRESSVIFTAGKQGSP